VVLIDVICHSVQFIKNKAITNVRRWGLGYGCAINEALSPLQNILTCMFISGLSFQNYITLQCDLF